jgi:hypothetical protein
MTASPKEKRKTAQMKIFLCPSPLEKVPKGDEVPSHKFDFQQTASPLYRLLPFLQREKKGAHPASAAQTDGIDEGTQE